MIKNLFREISMANVRGYKRLTEHQKDVFDLVYQKHLATMNADKKIRFCERQLQEIGIDTDGLMVYFRNGSAFKYKENKTWENVSY